MSSWRELAVCAVLAMGVSAALAQSLSHPDYPGIGRPATPAELAAWDIDVRPDFKGLPKGSGSAARGQQVWEAKCASCHGVFGESGEVFHPIVGGTTPADVRSGHVANLTDRAYPGRTTLMKLPTVSTLWDYINRAMPWAAPKSLSTEEVYATSAYLLYLGGVVPEGFVLSDRNIAEIQRRLPNRNGMATRHALWPGKGLGGTKRPDVQGSACMSRCGAEPTVVSFIPEHARNAHGNLAEQNRQVGAQRGLDTSTPTSAAAAAPAPNPGLALAQKHSCTACHGISARIVGPAFQEVARKHAARADLVAYLSARIKTGGTGVWGNIPMPEQGLPDADAAAIAQWLAAGAIP